MPDQPIIYLDNNATTAIAPEVLEAMMPYLTRWYGNPSSPHAFGDRAKRGVDKARQQLAALLGAEPDEILFTGCGSEADNAAILSALENDPRRRRVVTSAVEHPAVLSLCKVLQQRGYHIDYLPVDSHGRISLERLRALVSEETAIVSLMWANNEVGNLYPVEPAAEIAHGKGALFHTDAVQAVGKVPINLKATAIDLLSLSGHKLHAPKGIGAIYRRRFTPFHPFLVGGHQEFGLRAGTENVPGIVALGQAAELAGAHLETERTAVAALRDRLERGLLAACPDPVVNGDLESRLPNTSSISFKFIEGESILMHLGKWGVCASSGSACTSGSLEPSHVLRAMHVPEIALHGTIRFSLSRFNTPEEIDLVIAKLPAIVRRLREISPYGRLAGGCAACGGGNA
ncbi:MAG: cysteine desulfurase NifS [Lentisphaeria bacterium]|jgi:cysteine desulfurase